MSTPGIVISIFFANLLKRQVNPEMCMNFQLHCHEIESPHCPRFHSSFSVETIKKNSQRSSLYLAFSRWLYERPHLNHESHCFAKLLLCKRDFTNSKQGNYISVTENVYSSSHFGFVFAVWLHQTHTVDHLDIQWEHVGGWGSNQLLP